jgi:hypothetical protein
MTPPHPFDNAIHLDTIDGNVRRGRTHPEWANQVGPFGGITAAVMLRAIETTQPDRIGEPLALTVNFAAPIADGDFDISLRARAARLCAQFIAGEEAVTQDIQPLWRRCATRAASPTRCT